MIDADATTPASLRNRRCDRRQEAHYPVLLADCDAMTHNISESGVYFETDHQLDVGQRIRFAVLLPPDPSDSAAKPFVWCDGRVVRVDVRGAEHVGVGVAFEHCYAHM